MTYILIFQAPKHSRRLEMILLYGKHSDHTGLQVSAKRADVTSAPIANGMGFRLFQAFLRQHSAQFFV